MESKQQQTTIGTGKFCEKPINKEDISKEVSDFMVAQMKYDRKDIRHKIIYINK